HFLAPLVDAAAIENDVVLVLALLGHGDSRGDRSAVAHRATEAQALPHVDGPWPGQLGAQDSGDQSARDHSVRNDIARRRGRRIRRIQMRRIDIAGYEREQLDVLLRHRVRDTGGITLRDFRESTVLDNRAVAGVGRCPAGTISTVAASASRGIVIGVAPAWLPRSATVASNQRSAWTLVTMPLVLPSASSTGPCSICLEMRRQLASSNLRIILPADPLRLLAGCFAVPVAQSEHEV